MLHESLPRRSRHYPGGWEDYCLQENLSVFKAEQPAEEEAGADLPQPFYNFYDPQLYYYR